jgi:hypothetical protein
MVDAAFAIVVDAVRDRPDEVAAAVDRLSAKLGVDQVKAVLDRVELRLSIESGEPCRLPDAIWDSVIPPCKRH